MSEIKVNKISPRTACGTTTLGDSGDTFTLPSGATITIASGATISNAGTAAGFGGTGEISWDTTVKTTGTFTATAGVGYFLNTTSGTITVNLPAGAAGSSVAFADYAGTWNDNKVTVSPNGTETIGGVNADVDLTTQGQSVTFVYIDGTQGWVNVLDSTSNVRGSNFIVATGGCITTSGDYKIHTFLAPGTFCVSAGAGAFAAVDYFVVAGGGGGGGTNSGNDSGGGGGAGGFRLSNSTCMSAPQTSPLAAPNSPSPGAAPVSIQGYSIVVGGGGAGGPSSPTVGTQGDTSTFSTISSAGGAGGGGLSPRAGGSGGSGGGSGGSAAIEPGGTGNTPVTSPPQGNDGGPGGGTPLNYYGGGGGGAGCAGSKGESPNNGGPGGAGSFVVGGIAFAGCHGEPGPVPGARYFAGGGAGGGTPTRPITGGGTGGVGGGGDGRSSDPAGSTNMGGGGGGGDNSAGRNGGSGIVIIRYKYQ
jgi:hypothetical protein